MDKWRDARLLAPQPGDDRAQYNLGLNQGCSVSDKVQRGL